MSEIGLLTLCTSNDWHKAIAMACSVKRRNRKLPIAVVASPTIAHNLISVFDLFIPERTDISGFAHKLYLDEYSPFNRTLFVDADILAFKDLEFVFQSWRGRPFAARGYLRSHGTSSFGLNRSEVLRKLGKDKLVVLDGAGHAYFEKPSCFDIFKHSRHILENYNTIAPGASIADEDIMGIVMTDLGIEPVQDEQIVGFLDGIDKKTLDFDVVEGKCTYIDQIGNSKTPALLHFPRRTVPLFYHLHMSKIVTAELKEFHIPFYRLGLRDYIVNSLWWSIKGFVKRVIVKLQTH